ncbi:MAG: HEAT repeat domain-containing protein [Myxococcales bacterium]
MADSKVAEAVEGDSPEVDPLSIPENKERFEIAKEFAFHLSKGIKNIGIYKHNTAKYGEMLQKCYDATLKYTTRWNGMQLKVEADCFSMFKQPVFLASENENLPFKFYRDGIRHLIFREGLTLDELLNFVLIALTDTQRGDPDILSQLWEASFDHIEYVVVEGFSIDGMTEEQVKVEVEKVVGYLYQRLRSDSDDYLRFARLTAQDLELSMDNVDQVRGAVIAGATATEQQLLSIKDELHEDYSARLFPKLVTAVFQVIDEGGFADIDSLREIFVQLLDAMLLQEDFATVNSLLVKFRAMEREPDKAQMAQDLRSFFLTKMGEEQRLRRIGEVLNTTKGKHNQEIFRYLYSLDPGVIPTLLSVLETVEIPENRVILCDALAALGKDMPEPFALRLGSEKSQLVRDMIYIIDKCDFPDKMKYFGETLKNPNLAVRLEALNILSRSKSEQCRRFIVSALQDPNTQMRVQAARVLPNMSPGKAYLDLHTLIKSSEFEKRDLKEKEAVFSALGSTLQEGALAMFVQMLAQKGLLRRAKIKEDKLLAISGLGSMPSIPSYKALQAVTEEKGNDMEVSLAARKALHNMKKTLFPEQDDSAAKEPQKP